MQTTTNAVPVDVLAKLDRAESILRNVNPGGNNFTLSEARAAIAELIEAVAAVASVLEGPQDRLGRLRTNPNNPLTALRMRYECGPARDYLDGSAHVLRATLRRCGGAE